jgi:hypothetical protein
MIWARRYRPCKRSQVPVLERWSTKPARIADLKKAAMSGGLFYRSQTLAALHEKKNQDEKSGAA